MNRSATRRGSCFRCCSLSLTLSSNFYSFNSSNLHLPAPLELFYFNMKSILPLALVAHVLYLRLLHSLPSLKFALGSMLSAPGRCSTQTFLVIQFLGIFFLYCVAVVVLNFNKVASRCSWRDKRVVPRLLASLNIVKKLSLTILSIKFMASVLFDRGELGSKRQLLQMILILFLCKIRS